MLELRKISARSGGNRLGRRLYLAAALVALAMPLGACTGGESLWEKLTTRSDDVAPEEPADKLYNEGLFLMNDKKDPKSASKKF